VGVLWATPALADPPTDPAAAETLFEEGRKLLDAKKVDEACAKFEASNRMDPAVGTLLNLGDCNEKRGRHASAWSNYKAAQSLALTRNDTTRADFAKKKADGVQPKVSMLTIAVQEPVPGLKVSRDGQAIDEGAWGTPIPTDPGPHTVEATAPNKKPSSQKITIPEAASNQTLKIEPLVSDGTAPPPVTPPPGEKKDDLVVREPFLTTGRIIGFAGIGIGAIAVGVGAVFALGAKSTWNEALDAGECDSNAGCTEDGLVTNENARSKGNVATAFIVSGLVVAAIGVGCLLFWPKPAPPKPATAFNPQWKPQLGAGFAF
jgi:hypothetical protein